MISTKIENKISTPQPHHKGKGGFTIVELLVAAVIVIIAVIAVVAVVRKSTDLQVSDYNRRQARAFIMNKFEKQYGYVHFGGDYRVTEYGETPHVPTLGGVTVPRADEDPIVVIIGEGTPNPLRATMVTHFQVVPVSTGAGTGAHIVETHVITITLTWIEIDGTSQTLTMSKQLAESI